MPPGVPDVDLDRGTVMVRRALVPDSDGGWTFAEAKTRQSLRTVPLPPSVTRVLAEHKRRQAEERLAAGPEYSNKQLVFATPTGEPLDIRNLVNRHFKKVLEAAKLPKSVRLYDLRHSCATLLLAQGEHPKIVSERLGHASITLTLDTYSHVLPTMQQQAAERLESVLFSGKK
jgi:integrase